MEYTELREFKKMMILSWVNKNRSFDEAVKLWLSL